MKAYRFKGTDNDGHTIIKHFDKKEYAELPEYKMYNLQFDKEEELKGDIVSWSPFVAKYKSWDRRNLVTQHFVCPVCGCESCVRPNSHFSDPFFLQGNFKCAECGMYGFNYYSTCFIATREPLKITENEEE